VSLETAIVERLYTAFQRRDHVAMASCYAPDAHFSDPVFADVRGARIAAMWQMLCERATDLRLDVLHVAADRERGSAHWSARYTFSRTGRPVHNIIHARFRFADGKISWHRDTFSLYRWARQALGLKGVLLGWSAPVQAAIRAEAARNLDTFIADHGLTSLLE
jgi:ketosteroid isomerase-like protein